MAIGHLFETRENSPLPSAAQLTGVNRPAADASPQSRARRLKPGLAAAVVLGVLALVGLGMAATHGTVTPSAVALTGVGVNDLLRPVKVVRVVPDAKTATQTYTGVVRARYEADLGFRVGGKVTARLVEVGDAVRAGQPLARLDPTDYDLAVKSAEAELTAAEAAARNAASEDDRFRRLAGSGATSQSEADRTRDTRKSAAARVDQLTRAVTLARNRLGYCTLAADADGVVMALSVEVGQVVAEAQPVARVARDGDREAVVSVPENRVAEARAATARATLWSVAGPGYPAVLRELSPSADPTTRTYQARFTLQQTKDEATLGRTVTVHLAGPNASARFALPLAALTRHGDGPAVWRVDGDRLVLTPVTVADYREDAVVVTAGVGAGDVVVAAGVQKLDAGLRVRPWEGPR